MQGVSEEQTGAGGVANGGSLTIVGQYGGIGANYGVWTARMRTNWPF